MPNRTEGYCQGYCQRHPPAGCSWFGYETETQCLHGIWSHKLESFLDFLVANRFNAIRVPFTAELALDLDAALPAQSAINFTENGILEVS